MAYINGKKVLSVVKTEGVPIANLQEKTATPTTSNQEITFDEGYGGLSKVNINAVTSSIDNNIQAENIKKNVTILGVTGTFEGSTGVNVVGTYTSIGTNAFRLTNITNYTNNNATSVNESSFFGCSKLTEINTPNLATSSGNYCFAGCRMLTSVSFPLLQSLRPFMFSDCYSLEEFLFKGSGSIGQGAFGSCTALKSITITNDSVCTLSNSNAIPSNQNITIYVPSDLIESYKTATNWSTLYNNGHITFEAITE